MGSHNLQRLGTFNKGSNQFTDYELEGKCLGRGAYAVVRKAIHKPSGRLFACKTYNRLKITRPTDIKNLYSELSILEELQHPSIIQFYEKFEDTRHIHLIMECGGDKNLKDFIKQRQ